MVGGVSDGGSPSGSRSPQFIRKQSDRNYRHSPNERRRTHRSRSRSRSRTAYERRDRHRSRSPGRRALLRKDERKRSRSRSTERSSRHYRYQNDRQSASSDSEEEHHDDSSVERKRKKAEKKMKKEKKKDKKHKREKHKDEKRKEVLNKTENDDVDATAGNEQTGNKVSMTSGMDVKSFFGRLKEQEAGKSAVGTVHASGIKPPAPGNPATDQWECSRAGCGHKNSKYAAACNKCGAMKRMSEWR